VRLCAIERGVPRLPQSEGFYELIRFMKAVVEHYCVPSDMMSRELGNGAHSRTWIERDDAQATRSKAAVWTLSASFALGRGRPCSGPFGAFPLWRRGTKRVIFLHPPRHPPAR
jgi:hypothetical protein